MPKPILETIGDVTVRRWPKTWSGLRTISDAFTNVEQTVFDVSCNVSEISNPFEDITREEDVQKRILKSDVKLKADQELMDQFSDDYKRAISTVRKEMGLGADMLLEDPEYIRSHAATYEEVKKTPKELLALAEEIMKDVDIDINVKAHKEEPKKVLEITETEVYDNRSAIWRMLGAHEDFKVSTAGFDAFRGPKPHWLQQDEVDLTIREEARSKCLAWLQQAEPPTRQSARKEKHVAPKKLRVIAPRNQRK